MGNLLLHRFGGGGGEHQQHGRELQRERHHPRLFLPAVLAPDVSDQNRFGGYVQWRKRWLQAFANAAPERAIPWRIERRQEQPLQVVGGRNHRPVQLRRAILHTRPIAPVPDGSAKMPEWCSEGRYSRLTGRALRCVWAFFKTDVTDEMHENSLLS